VPTVGSHSHGNKLVRWRGAFSTQIHGWLAGVSTVAGVENNSATTNLSNNTAADEVSSAFASISAGLNSGSPTAGDLLRWSEALSGIARTGLGFSESLYERERYEEVLHVAADMRIAAQAHANAAIGSPTMPELNELRAEWMRMVGSGVPGYVTPKIAVGAVVGNDNGEILLIQRSDSGHWLYPTGWADIGYSASEVAVKEVAEETGIECEPVGVIGIYDGLRLGFTSVPLYSIVFFCRATGGALNPHPLEAQAVGWFAQDALPSPIVSVDRWGAHAFAAIRGENPPVMFDLPRSPVWRNE
jgi:ADP-ribose pyrophosphatase YjhB (NUDIX family)